MIKKFEEYQEKLNIFDVSESKQDIIIEYLSKKDIENIIKSYYNRGNESVKKLDWEKDNKRIKVSYIRRK